MLLKSLPADLLLHVISLPGDTDRQGLCVWCTRLGAEAPEWIGVCRRSPPPLAPPSVLLLSSV